MEIRVPTLGESLVEATVGQWRKRRQAGDDDVANLRQIADVRPAVRAAKIPGGASSIARHSFASSGNSRAARRFSFSNSSARS